MRRACSGRVRPLALLIAVLVALVLVAMLVLSRREHDDRASPSAAPAAVVAQSEPAPLPSPTARPAPLEELRAEPEPVVATEPAATAARGGRIEVLVRDEKGSPVAGFALFANMQKDGDRLARGEDLRALGFVAAGVAIRQDTDASGRATWEDLKPGTWSLDSDSSMRLDGVSVQPAWVNAQFSVLGESYVDIDVEAGSTARHVFEVARRAQVVVKLDEIPNESELEELALSDELHDEARRLHSAIERTLGATQVEWSVAPGEWVLSARWAAGSGCWSRPVLLDLQPGERREVAIASLPAQVTWGGRVVDTEGRPVGGVVLAITVREHGGSPGWKLSRLNVLAEKRVSSADDGTWALAVPAGVAALEVDTANGRGRYLAEYDINTKLGLPTQPIEIVVASACIVDAVVTLPPAPPLESDLVDDAVWTVALRRQTGPSTWSNIRTERLSHGGSISFKCMAAGRYQAELSYDGTVARVQHFEIGAGFTEGDRIAVALDFSR